jgi:hypothetical protein
VFNSPALRRVIRRDLGHAEGVVRGERERKEEIAESIRPLKKLRPLRFVAVQRPQFPLGPSGDRASHVKLGRDPRTPRQDERSELRMRGIELVDLRFEANDVPRLDPVRGRFGPRRHSELRLSDVELVLESEDRRCDVRERRRKVRFEEPELGSELVERPVRANARRILLYPRTTGETRGASVAGPGVEARDTLISGRQGSASSGELSPWTGQ